MRLPAAFPCLLALTALYAPLYWAQAQGPWQSTAQSHAPAVILICLWLVWRARTQLASSNSPCPWLGSLSLGAGLGLFVLGKLLASPGLGLSSQFPVFAGVALILGGWPWLRVLAFPLAFLLLSLPLEGALIDPLTAPLKLGISASAETLLHLAGYPIARSGVVLHLSQYRLLVDDACSGLYSLIFLIALGGLFVHLLGVRSRWHRFWLLASSLPIALAANLLRVLLIALATYHAGDRVGQGPIHDLSGVVMFLAALMALFAVDAALRRRWPTTMAAQPTAASSPLRLPRFRQALVCAPILAGIALSHGLLTPAQPTRPASTLDLAQLIPSHFGRWQADLTNPLTPISSDAARKAAEAYTQTLTRVYVDADGQQIMLTVVHGHQQTQERWQMHRPEYCYSAQGFTVNARHDDIFATAYGQLPLRHLDTERPGRREAVSYWLTVGEEGALPGLSRKLAQLRQSLAGHAPDGLLVRISSLAPPAPATQARHEAFIRELLAHLPADAARRLIGSHLPGAPHAPAN